MRTRIVQVVTSVCAGGLSRYLLDLFRHLDRERYEIHLLCTHFEGPHYAEAREWAASAEVLGAQRPWEKLTRLANRLRRLQPAVVHCHQEPAGLLAGRQAGVPTRIETIHMADYWKADGRPGYRQLAWACATRHLVYTADQKRIVSQFVPAAKVQVVSPGLDLARLTGWFRRETLPQSGALRNASLVVGTVSRLDPEKGVGYLIEAAPQILAAAPEARFLIVGDGALRGELEARLRELAACRRSRFGASRTAENGPESAVSKRFGTPQRSKWDA